MIFGDWRHNIVLAGTGLCHIFCLLARGLNWTVSGALGTINCTKISAQRARRVAICVRFPYHMFVIPGHDRGGDGLEVLAQGTVWHKLAQIACVKAAPNIPTLCEPGASLVGTGPDASLVHLQGACNRCGLPPPPPGVPEAPIR